MTTTEPKFLPVLDLSTSQFLQHETATIVRTVTEYNQWATSVNETLENARGTIFDLLLELRSYAMDGLENAHVAASEQAVQMDNGYAFIQADDIQGAPYEFDQLLTFSTVAAQSAKEMLG